MKFFLRVILVFSYFALRDAFSQTEVENFAQHMNIPCRLLGGLCVQSYECGARAVRVNELPNACPRFHVCCAKENSRVFKPITLKDWGKPNSEAKIVSDPNTSDDKLHNRTPRKTNNKYKAKKPVGPPEPQPQPQRQKVVTPKPVITKIKTPNRFKPRGRLAPHQEQTRYMKEKRKKRVPKSVSPRTAIQNNLSPKGSMLKSLSPKEAMPKGLSPKGAMPRSVLPKGAMPKGLSPKRAMPKDVLPKGVIQKSLSPKGAMPKRVLHKGAMPKGLSPKRAILKSPSPKGPMSKRLSPKGAMSKGLSLKGVMPTSVSHKTAMPKSLSPKRAKPKSLWPKRVIPKNLSPKKIIPKNLSPKGAMPKSLFPKKPMRKSLSPKRVVPKPGIKNFVSKGNKKRIIGKGVVKKNPVVVKPKNFKKAKSKSLKSRIGARAKSTKSKAAKAKSRKRPAVKSKKKSRLAVAKAAA